MVMIIKLAIFYYPLLLIFLNCNAIKQDKLSFKLGDAYYQPWVINDNEKGTDVLIELTHVDKGITFDSLIFRGVQLPVFVLEGKDKLILKSKLYAGLARLPIASKPDHKPDQLIYTSMGKKYYFLLKKIRPLKTVYYR
jgi:hypothetical protein